MQTFLTGLMFIYWYLGPFRAHISESPYLGCIATCDIKLCYICLFSNREGLGTSLWIMGLATIDPRSHKMQTKLYKILKFGVNRPKSKKDTAIWKCQNLQRNVRPFTRCRTQRLDAIRLYISLLILTFLFRCISVKTGLINTKLGNLWISVCSFWLCGSIVANPIIYRLLPSPSQFEK